MEFFYSMIKFFTAGGLFMLPIVLTGAIAIAITLERYITLATMGARNRRTWTKVESVLTSITFPRPNERTAITGSGPPSSADSIASSWSTARTSSRSRASRPASGLRRRG